MNDIQTILIETDEQARVALRLALRSQPGIEVASEATNGTTGLVLLESIDVDVAIVDANLLDMSITQFAQQMRELQEEATVTRSKLLILVDLQKSQSLWDAWAVKAEGYCQKTSPIENIAEAVRQVHAGSRFLALCDRPVSFHQR